MRNIEQRKEPREGIIGDVIWADASAAKENDGVLVEQSKSGMSILTGRRVKEGSILRVCCKGSWMGDQYVIVKWCLETDPGIFRCGLWKIKHY